MDWVNRMNKTIDYVEEHLTDKVEDNEICKIMACSFTAFQNSFTQITGISLSEYIRRRKLSYAAYELQNTDEKVIDIALKYGYQSPDAFNAAFKRLHGVAPLYTRKSNIKFTFYCRINLSLIIKGVDKMDYTMIERAPFKVIGIRRTTPYGGGTWAIVKSDVSNESIKELSGHFYDLGLCFGFDKNGNNDYMCAIEWDKENASGLDSYEYPSTAWLKFKAKGTITGQTLGNVWQRINSEFFPQSKYKKSDLPSIEKYVLWNEETDVCNVEIWIPISLK